MSVPLLTPAHVASHANARTIAGGTWRGTSPPARHSPRESDVQRALLKRGGSREAQGYLFAEPMLPAEIAPHLRSLREPGDPVGVLAAR